jgi:hypothetical protein
MNRSERKEQLMKILQGYDGSEGIETAAEMLLDSEESAGIRFDPEENAVERWNNAIPGTFSCGDIPKWLREIGDAMRDELQAQLVGKDAEIARLKLSESPELVKTKKAYYANTKNSGSEWQLMVARNYIAELEKAMKEVMG